MAEMLLINPRRRRRKKTAARRPKRRRTASKRRRRNPVPAALAANPRRRRRRKTRSVSRRRRRNPASRSIGRRFSAKGIQSQVMNAVPGAVGALGLDVLLGVIPVPANWKVGIAGYLVKAAGAIGLGALAANFVRPATANAMTEGALTVMMHGILRNMTQQYAPQIPLGMYVSDNPNGMGYYGAGWNPNYDALPGGNGAGMGMYLPDLSAPDYSAGAETVDGYYSNYSGDYS